MELKRLYHRITGDNGEILTEYAHDDAGNLIIDPVTHRVKRRVKVMRTAEGVPIVRGILIKRMPLHGAHNFAPKTIEAGIAEGWLSMSDTHITINCDQRGQVRFKITRKPGRRCLICGADLPGVKDDPGGVLARKHIADEHPDATLPHSSEWPGGYDVENGYMTEVEGDNNG